MKVKLFIVLVLIFANSEALTTCPHDMGDANKNVTNLGTDGLKAVNRLVAGKTEPDWKEDFEDVCDEIVSSLDDGEDTVETARVQILSLLEKDKSIKMLSGEMIDILNENLSDFECEADIAKRVRDKASLFKFAIELRYYKFVRDILIPMSCGAGIDGKKLNINHYDMVNGKKETLLDYINLILEKPGNSAVYDFSSLSKIKSDIIACGAEKGENP